MRNILALVGAATVAFLILGWYLGWYQVSSLPTPQGKQSVQVEINPTRITEDVKQGVAKGGQIVDSLRERPAADPKPAPAAGPASSFFAPTPTQSERGAPPSGWRPIPKSPQPDDTSPGPRVPRN